MAVYTWLLVPEEPRGIELQQTDITNSCEPPNVGTGNQMEPSGIELQQADITNSCAPPNVGTGNQMEPSGRTICALSC